MIHAKALIRADLTSRLHETNKAECARLMERWTSQECMQAIMAFFQRKKPKLWFVLTRKKKEAILEAKRR